MTTDNNEHALNLVDTTVRAFNGDVTSVSIIDSVSLIDSWISILRDHNEQTNIIADGLSNLKAELRSGNPDGEQIQQILADLVGQTKQVTNPGSDDTTAKVNELADALQEFSQQVSGKSGAANTGGQAPMTSTVGGESTNSGTGNSATDSSNDPLANRTGGIISDAIASDQSEEADSNQPSTTGGAATGGNMADATGDDYTKSANANESRSDTGRVGGSGISGGTGDTDSSQSGGRSQY